MRCLAVHSAPPSPASPAAEKHHATMPVSTPQLVYRIAAGTACMLAAIGLIRYAYAPMLPSMLHHHWLTPASAAYVSSVNFGANLLSALLVARIARRFSAGAVARCALMLGVLATAADAMDYGPLWVGSCRLLAGCAAAGVIILVPVICVEHVQSSLRSLMVGLIFAGGGIGVIASSLLIPMATTEGPAGGWIMISAGTLACTIVAWPLLRGQPNEHAAHHPTPLSTPAKRAMAVLAAAYLLFAVSTMPHTIFLSAYLHHDLHVSQTTSARAFAAYGVGILAGGPVMSSLIASRSGLRPAALASALTGLTALLLVLWSRNLVLIAISAVMLGIARMGMISLVSSCCRELAGPAGHARWWGRMSAVFTGGIMAGTLILGGTIQAGGTYLDGFWIAAGCSAGAAVLFCVFLILPLRGLAHEDRD